MQPDERLSRLFSRGVDPAFDELVRRYRAPLTVFAGGIVGRDRAEDVVQESLVKAHRSMATEDIHEPKAWLYRVVRNTALNEIRDGAKHDHDELTEWGSGGTRDQAAEEAERREELAMLISALAELPESQRTALVGKELGGYTHEELAEKLGVSRGATKQLIFRARTGLRNALGALVPMPLIVWLASDVTGTFVASGAGTATAAGVAGVAGGTGGVAGGAAAGATGAATGGSLFAGLAGGGAAKVAVVAAVAGGTVAAGVAVEEKRASETDPRPAVVRSIQSPGTDATTGGVIPALAGSGSGDGSGKSGAASGASAGPERNSGQAGDGSGKGSDDEPLAGADPEGPGAPGGSPEEVGTGGEQAGIPGKGFGRRPGAEKPWKEAGYEKPWKASGGEKPWKGIGSGRPGPGSGFRPSGTGSSGRPSRGSGGGPAPARPLRPSRPVSPGLGGPAQSSSSTPGTEAVSPRPGSGRLGTGKRTPGS